MEHRKDKKNKKNNKHNKDDGAGSSYMERLRSKLFRKFQKYWKYWKGSRNCYDSFHARSQTHPCACSAPVSSIKYTTNCLCHMHWLSPNSLIIIGILPIVHSLYFSYFCIAEALWTPMDSFQLYSHLVRIRSAA